MNSPAVSVIIPTYNRAQMLCEALASVRRQTVQDFEVLVVDDGSSDDTAAVAKAFAPQAIYLRQEHGGVAAARNLGIRSARASYIAFLDSDDLWLPHKLERQLAFLREHPSVGLLYARMWSYHVDRPTERQLEPRAVARSFDELLNGPNTVTTSTVIVRRECFDIVGLFDPSLPTVEDHELWLRIAHRFPLAFLEEPVAEYRRHGGGFNADHAALYEGYRRFYELMLRDHRSRLRNPKAATRQLAKFEYLCGTAALKQGERQRALHLISQALRRDPALGSQFVTPNISWPAKLWLPIKPYAAWTASILKAVV